MPIYQVGDVLFILHRLFTASSFFRLTRYQLRWNSNSRLNLLYSSSREVINLRQWLQLHDTRLDRPLRGLPRRLKKLLSQKSRRAQSVKARWIQLRRKSKRRKNPPGLPTVSNKSRDFVAESNCYKDMTRTAMCQSRSPQNTRKRVKRAIPP